MSSNKRLRVAALSLAGISLNQPEHYVASLVTHLKELQVGLTVLPAHTSFLLCLSSGYLGQARDFLDSYRLFMSKSREWNDHYLQIHSGVAEECGVYLVAGTTVEEVDGRFYHTSYCFGPDGAICCKQRQTHLSREERGLGMDRGDELQVFDIAEMKAGLVVGTDARHPEVSRIFAMLGVDLIAHSGAIEAGHSSLTQPAGIWAQVQQNQVWGVEAQLNASICDRTFAAQCAIIGPCEVTCGSTGYLDREDTEKPFAAAELIEADLHKIRGEYPLLRLLNPTAYRGKLPELYGEAEGANTLRSGTVG